MFTRGRKALALGALVLLVLAAQPATAQQATCTNMVLPTPGTDANPGYIPAGPILVAPDPASEDYKYVINAADKIELHVLSDPPVGGSDKITRKLSVLLATGGAEATETYPTGQAVNPACEAVFAFDAPVAVNTLPPKGVGLGTMSLQVTDQLCKYDFAFAMPWADFLGTDAAKCGFEEAVDGKSKKYTGRVYVKWQDYNFGTDTTTLGATRGPMSMWYDVSITVQQTEQSTSSPVGNTETPYNADTFKVLGSTYSKATNGYVTVNFVYEATTNYPYYASLPESATNFLVHGAGNKYGDLTLTGSWLNAYALASDGTNVLDGKHTEAGDTCGLGETCVMRGTLSYTWDPTGASCTLNSASNLQFDLTLDCADNGATNVCGEKMRTALGEEYSNIGAFKLAGNIDFCKTAVSDFPIAWGDTPFGVEGPTTRTIGAQIVTSGTFTSEKKIYAVGLTNYRVKRSDTLIFSLFNKDSVETDKRTTFGKNSAFVYTPTDVDSNGFKWKVEGKFTPNVKVDATAAYDTYMIALPVDNGATLSFTMIIDMRLYTTSATSRRRRLLFRQVEVPALEPAALAEASATTNPISVNVPQNVKVATDGTISFAASSNSLSTGAIAGIAVAGAVVGIAGIALAVFAIRRHKRNAQASESVDSEKAAIEKMAIPAAAAYAKTSTTGQIVA